MRLKLLAGLSCLALFAAACGSDDADSTSSSQGAVVAEQAQVQQVQAESAEPTEAEPSLEPAPTDAAEPTPEPEPVETAEAAALDGTSASAGCGAAASPGTTTVSMLSEGRDREYALVVPTGYDPDVATPLVLNWHGLGSNGPEQLTFTEYPALADNEGFIVVAPTGIPGPGEDRNSWELTEDQDPTRSDLLLASEILDEVIASLCIDQDRVYSTGMSNGGYFSSVLACEMSDRIAAVATIAALTRADDCSPERAVPMIGFHGTEDDVVPYDGSGTSSLAPGITVPLFELVIPEEFAEFADAAGCSIEPTIEQFSDNVTAQVYQGCDGTGEYTFYEIAGAGHTWPGSSLSMAVSEAFGLGITTSEIDATEVSWEFFQRHSLTS